ncbi:hypothetical protein GGI26_000428 [Coemansia sp. RSA 1358]|nr:hypothetical protein GGI26_000428 [Coemansia sp. RSA 1358]
MMTIRLQSNDGRLFAVDKETAFMSDLVKNSFEDLGPTTEPIPLPNVCGAVLAKVIEYCSYHKDDARVLSTVPGIVGSHTVVDAWDRRFTSVDDDMLLAVLVAADYLSIQPLVELGCTVIAKIIRNMSVEDIRARFGIVDDFTDDQRAQVREELERLK